MNREESLSKVCKNIMLKEPFYGLFIISLNKRWEKKVGTAGVAKKGINYELLINEDFWLNLSDDHKYGLLKHELLHIGFFHLTTNTDGLNKHICNIAMDLEINQYIEDHRLPEGGCTINTEPFAELNLNKRAGWRYYYDELMKQKDNEGASQRLKDLLNPQEGSFATDFGDMIPEHDWKDFDDMSESEKKLIQKQTQHVLNEISEQVTKSRGYVPGEIKSLLDKINYEEPPKFDWKGYVRRFTGSSQKVFTKKLRRKENKRFEDNPGLKIKKKRHLLVAIDTSGSVSEPELVEFFQEINHIHKTGSDITVIQCDTAISSIKEYKPNEKIEINGRGGTDFDPVLEYYNANNDKYTCMIYLTDGECNTDISVKGKMLWVISTRGQINTNLKGPQIKLN